MAKEFSEDLYGDGGILFCRFCGHSVDFTRVENTVKDHLKSRKHSSRKEAKRQSELLSGASSSRQTTLEAMIKSKDLRESFVLDYMKRCTVADITLEKMEKIRPF